MKKNRLINNEIYKNVKDYNKNKFELDSYYQFTAFTRMRQFYTIIKNI